MMSGHKRLSSQEDSGSGGAKVLRREVEAREECMFGSKCFRRNPHHFANYSHPHLLSLCLDHPDADPPLSKLASTEVPADVILAQLSVFRDVCRNTISSAKENGSSSSCSQKKREPDTNGGGREEISKVSEVSKSTSEIRNKLDKSKKMSLFLSKVRDAPETHRAADSIYFSDLLHPSLGELKRSLQINFMVDWEWLWMNYEVTKNQDKELLIIYGEDNPDLSSSHLPANVKAACVKPPSPFGKHHTKMSVLQYDDDSVRVVVSTANLVPSDWENRTQGLWVSPRCPCLQRDGGGGGTGEGDSPTGFKASLLQYLEFYRVSRLAPFVEAVRRVDFSSVNVFFISSVPGSHEGSDMNLWGHRRLANLLRRHVGAGSGDWQTIVQCSSIGSLGPKEEAWLKGEFGKALNSSARGGLGSVGSVGQLSVVYPSKQDVLGSYDGLMGGGCLPYSMRTHEKQRWLERHLRRWRSVSRHRSRAMPHVKTYTRVDPDGRRAAFLVLTSANLSKAAWGALNKAGGRMQIQSYEAGVLFLPGFVLGEDRTYFELGQDIQLPYDLPLVKYADEDSVWFMDYLRAAMD